MAQKLSTIGFDADDTLWHNERYFRLSQDRFVELLSEFTDTASLEARLLEAEKRNLGHYGFGVKGFVLSMIETAIEVTDGKVAAPVISELLDVGRDLLAHPIDLLPHAREVIETLAPDFTLVLITKGDLLHQERKLAQSGLGEMFDAVEIVSDKTPGVYAEAFARHGQGPEAAMMVGNSLKSDVIPAIEAGSWGVFVPHDITWEIEHAEPPSDAPRFAEIEDLGGLPGLIGRIL